MKWRYLGFLILGLTCIVTVLFIIAFSVVTNDRDMDYLYMVIFFAVLAFALLLGRREEYDELDEDYIESIDTEEIALHSKMKNGVDAEKILKRRYARGEIKSEEYTEKMSRL